MAFGDSTSANFAELTQEIIGATIALMPEEAPMIPLVTRLPIGKGHDRYQMPRVNTGAFDIQLPTEGDELVASNQFDLTSSTLQPTKRAILLRWTDRAEYFSRDDVVSLISHQLAQTQAQDIDQDLTAEFANFHTDNDVGTTNVDLDFDIIDLAYFLLTDVDYENGGPPNGPFYCVLSPRAYYDVRLDLGVAGLLGNNYVVPGMSQEMMQNYYIPQNRLSGVSLFRDGYMTEDGSGDYICAMFVKNALHFGVSQDWDMRTFEVPSFIGTIIRSVADYNSGLLGFTHHGAQITADGS